MKYLRWIARIASAIAAFVAWKKKNNEDAPIEMIADGKGGAWPVFQGPASCYVKIMVLVDASGRRIDAEDVAKLLPILQERGIVWQPK